jgi:hypothetical protein
VWAMVLIKCHLPEWRRHSECTHACASPHQIRLTKESDLPIQLEEMGLPYKVEAIDIMSNRQKGANACDISGVHVQ